MLCYAACVALAGLALTISLVQVLRSRRRSPVVKPPFDVAPTLVVALGYLAESRHVNGRERAQLRLFAGFALDDAREAASTAAERTAVALVTEMLVESEPIPSRRVAATLR